MLPNDEPLVACKAYADASAELPAELLDADPVAVIAPVLVKAPVTVAPEKDAP